MLGDVNISAILDSFSVSYDKRVRPNYGGTYQAFLICAIITEYNITNYKHSHTTNSMIQEERKLLIDHSN